MLFADEGRAGDAPPADLQAGLLARVLRHDAQLDTRSPTEIVLGLVYRGDLPESTNPMKAMERAFDALGPAAAGRAFVVHRLDLAEETLAEGLERTGARTLYLCPGLGAAVEDVTREARERKVPTLTGRVEYVDEGVAIGIHMEFNRPRLVIDVKAAEAQGMALGSQVLKLADLRR